MVYKELILQTAANVVTDTISSAVEGYIVVFDESTIVNQTLEIGITATDVINGLEIVFKNTQGQVKATEILDLDFKGVFLIKCVIDKSLTGLRFVAYVNKSSTAKGGTTIGTVKPAYPKMEANIQNYNFTVPLFPKTTSTYIPHTCILDGTPLLNDLKQKKINITVTSGSLNLKTPSSDPSLNVDLQNQTAPFDFKMQGGRILSHSSTLTNHGTTAPYNTAPFNYSTAPAGNSVTAACGEYQSPSAYDANSIFYFIKRPVRENFSEITSSIIVNVFFTFPIDTNVNFDYAELRNLDFNCFFNITNPFAPLVKLRIFFVMSYSVNGFIEGFEVPHYKSVTFFQRIVYNNNTSNTNSSALFVATESSSLNTFAKRLAKNYFICFAFHAMLNNLFTKPKAYRKLVNVSPAPLLSELCGNATQYYNSSVCDSVASHQFDVLSLSQVNDENIVSKSSEEIGYPAYYLIDNKKYNFITEIGASFQRSSGTLTAADIDGPSTQLQQYRHHPIGAMYSGTYVPAKYQLFFENTAKSAQDVYAHFLTKGLAAGQDISSIGLNAMTEINTGIGIPNPNNFAHFQFINPDVQADEFFVVIHGANSNMPLYSYYIDAATPMIKTNFYTEICYFFYLLFSSITQYKFIINPNSVNFCPNLPNLTYEQKVRMFRLRFTPFDELMGTKTDNDAVWANWFSSNKSLAITYTANGKITIAENTKMDYFFS